MTNSTKVGLARTVLTGGVLGATLAASLLVLPHSTSEAAPSAPVTSQTFPGTSVSVVGDSLTVASEKYLRELAQEARVRIGVDARIGRGTSEGVQVLSRPDRFAARVWVVALGTNDSQNSTDAFAQKVDQVMELAGPGRDVVWVDVYREGVSKLNTVLQDKQTEYSNLQVVEYADWVEGNRDLLYDDEVHLRETGSQKLATLVWGTVEQVLSNEAAK